MIRHTVAFRLQHASSSPEEQDFLAAARGLAAIPGVEAFEVMRQVGAKNDCTFGLSMEFADEASYAGYDAHPAHRAFVAERWLPEVADFLEIDYTPL
ncbi:Dabb family protein [Nocardioides KLBMP 9356]|uniref:Dabb family protein n=1 Tax=Nocardioides potassii TaxID=2911371 RepID=A0ABS9H4E5_9ACTN|nr:Dabb family protein [Nocardioides potassii]MCF6376102.1 Dabb family protein [Nocardioides potassii]